MNIVYCGYVPLSGRGREEVAIITPAVFYLRRQGVENFACIGCEEFFFSFTSSLFSSGCFEIIKTSVNRRLLTTIGSKQRRRF